MTGTGSPLLPRAPSLTAKCPWTVCTLQASCANATFPALPRSHHYSQASGGPVLPPCRNRVSASNSYGSCSSQDDCISWQMPLVPVTQQKRRKNPVGFRAVLADFVLPDFMLLIAAGVRFKTSGQANKTDLGLSSCPITLLSNYWVLMQSLPAVGTPTEPTDPVVSVRLVEPLI